LPCFCNVEFTKMNDITQHNGIIKRIDHRLVYVQITQQSACVGCHAGSICNAAECKERIIEVEDSTGTFHENEEVVLIGKTSLGYWAVLLAFAIPLVLLLLVIIGCSRMNMSETACAFIGLVVLPIYYSGLYFFKDKLKSKFVFTMKKT